MPTNPRIIADELAEALQGATWEFSPITIERRNWAAVDTEGMSNPVVFVVPGGVDLSRIGRLDWQADNSVTVFVGRHVTTDSDVDDMYDLTEEITTFIRATNISAATSPQNVSVEINPDDAMTERNVWRAVITATYRTLTSDLLPTEE